MKSTKEEGFEKQDFYTQGLDYEGLLNQQIGRIASFRSMKDHKRYFASIDTLIFMMPTELRKKALGYKKDNNISFNLSSIGIEHYDNLWEYCNELLEEANLIFKSRYIKTYS